MSGDIPTAPFGGGAYELASLHFRTSLTAAFAGEASSVAESCSKGQKK